MRSNEMFSRRSSTSTATTAAAVAVFGLGSLLATGCSNHAFDFSIHDPSSAPRVSVVHRPLHPELGQAFRLVARPEEPPGARVASVRITLLYPGGNQSRTCRPADLTPEGWCELEVPGGARREGLGVYSAEVTDDRGRSRRSPGTYVFQIGLPAAPSPGAPVTFPLRAPFESTGRVLDVLLVANGDSFGSVDSDTADRAAFTGAIESLLYDGLLEDPAYRWRDDQLGFHATTRVGVVTAYESGNMSRCGGNPWPGVSGVTIGPEIDAVGVLHTNDWRDCAGLGTLTAGAGTRAHFSSGTGDPLLFKHELGHALFGLGDEYWESTASRAAGGDESPPAGCCCRSTDNGGSTTGGGGLPDLTCLDPDAPTCGELWNPDCFPAGMDCPPIESSCAEPNVFPDEASCRQAASAASSHPGIEVATSPDDCRLLCSPGTEPCPCRGDQTVWLLDRRRPPVAGAPDDDVMGTIDSLAPQELHGAACALCIETELCLLWERGRGQSEDEARAHCVRP